MIALPRVWVLNVFYPDNKGWEKELRYELKRSTEKFGWARFFYSWDDEHNLLKEGWRLNYDNRQCKRLLDIEEGDWVIQKHCPEWGKCLAAKVIKKYSFDSHSDIETNRENGFKHVGVGDGRHVLGIDRQSIIPFDRNDPNVVPIVQSRLNLQGRLYRLYPVTEFLETLKNLKNNSIKIDEGEIKEEIYLKADTINILQKLPEILHKNFNAKKLEGFFKRVFDQIEGVKAIPNGSGWKSDFGADLILDIPHKFDWLSSENFTVVVQIKSYEGYHHKVSDIDQVKQGIEKFQAAEGILITTANSTDELEKKADEVSEEIGKPIKIIAGEDVAKFIIKNAPNLIFDLNYN